MEKIAITEINKNGKRYEIQDKGVRELLEKSDAELKRQGEQLSALDTDFQTYKNGHAESEMQVMAQLNNVMEIAANIANNARDSADQAAGSAESAAMSAENALTSAQQALDDSENALSYANAAKTYSEQANTYGNKAAESAFLAVTKASKALEISQEIDKQATELNASIAQSKAEIDEKVSNASSSAAAASSSASAAAGSATDASTSASKAATSESNSKKSADNASASATTAQNAATVAQSAASDAESSVASVTEKISALSKDIAQNFQISTIQPTATGDTVSLNDSAEYPIQELHLFGKSTQDGTPTPENPVDIVSVVNPTVESRNVSLFDFNSLPKNTCIKCFFKKGTRFGIVFKDGYTSLGGNLKFYDKDKVVMWCGLDKGITKTTYTLSNDCYMLMNESDNTNFMLYVYNGVYLPYEPYQGRKQKLNVTLRSIADVCDELIVRADDTGQLIQRINTKDITIGSWNVSKNSDNFIQFQTKIDTASSFNNIACNRLSSISLNDRDYKSGVVKYWDDSCRVSLLKKDYPNITDVNTFSDWLKQNPLNIAYILKTPIITEISAEQVQALHTYKPNTVITADGAGLSVKYVADPKTYIDNQITELSAALVDTASMSLMDE